MSKAKPENLNELLRQLPQVDAVLGAAPLVEVAPGYRKAVIKRLVQAGIEATRASIVSGKSQDAPSAEGVAQSVVDQLASLCAPHLKPTINATGIVLHTNLGRARLCESAQAAVQAVAGSYSNLELDLHSGKRTRRDVTLEPLLHALTGCEASTVVNNNAAAVFLTLSALAQGREVITSRGELVEIGGSYRVPDVVRAAGCELIEIGTTNRTHVDDYERAINENTGLILKTHTSNYRVRGFTKEIETDGLAALARKHNLPLFVDLGSGYMLPEVDDGLEEPDVVATLEAGADLVSFSGDKLLGGPQAGIVIGSQELILKLRADALWRVLRIDKFTAAALAATMVEHLKRNATGRPFVAEGTIAGDMSAQESLAKQLISGLREVQPDWQFTMQEGTSFFGGGTLPDEAEPAMLVTVTGPGVDSDRLDESLRRGDPAVVGYMVAGAYALNMATLLKGDLEKIVGRIAEVPSE